MTTRRFTDTRGFKFGAGMGALVLTGAGAVWSVVALIYRTGAAAWEYGVVALPVLTLVVLGVRRLAAVAKLPTPEPLDAARVEGARQGRRMGLLFGIVFTVEAVLIALAAVLLAHAHRPLLIPVAVIAIVGAHFVPLARIFSIPTYGVAGVVLVGLAAASLLIPTEATRVFTLSIASALVLWASAGAVLALHVKARSSDDEATTP